MNMGKVMSAAKVAVFMLSAVMSIRKAVRRFRLRSRQNWDYARYAAGKCSAVRLMFVVFMRGRLIYWNSGVVCKNTAFGVETDGRDTLKRELMRMVTAEGISSFGNGWSVEMGWANDVRPGWRGDDYQRLIDVGGYDLVRKVKRIEKIAARMPK